MKNLPTISIITPTLNQGAFIEQTILSVLNQHYPNLEYLIMDGGSTDQTLSIVSRYKKQLTCISQKDKGQSDAINKGLKRVSGEIVAFVNSDDYLQSGSLQAVADYFLAHPSAQWVTGKCHIVDEQSREVRPFVTVYKNLFLRFFRRLSIFCVVQFISQPATFWRREVVEAIGLFDESLHYDMDYDYWLRIWKTYPPGYINRYLASYRVHSNSKAVVSPETQFRVEHEILKKYTQNSLLLAFHSLHVRIALFVYRFFFIPS